MAAVLALALVGGMVFLAGRGSTPVPVAAPAGGVTVANATTSAVPDDEDSASAVPDDEDSARPATEQTLCWDGTVESNISSCGEPSGPDGVRYIYPVFGDRGTCTSKPYRETTVTYDCTYRKDEVVRYRWWSDTTEAEAHYRYKFRKGATSPLVIAGQEVGILYRDTKPVDGVYRMSGFMRDHFSFSVEARTKARQKVLLQIIRMRHPDDYAGYPLESGPKETVHVKA